MEKHFYVFDKFDCWDQFCTLEAASAKAAWLIGCEFTGVYIKEMTAEEFEAYCTKA